MSTLRLHIRHKCARIRESHLRHRRNTHCCTTSNRTIPTAENGTSSPVTTSTGPVNPIATLGCLSIVRISPIVKGCFVASVYAPSAGSKYGGARNVNWLECQISQSEVLTCDAYGAWLETGEHIDQTVCLRNA